MACGQMQVAVNALEGSPSPTTRRTTCLIPRASITSPACAIAAVAQGTSEITQGHTGRGRRHVRFGCREADGAPIHLTRAPAAYGQRRREFQYYADAYGEQAYSGTEAGDHFFNASDEELEKFTQGRQAWSQAPQRGAEGARGHRAQCAGMFGAAVFCTRRLGLSDAGIP